MIVFPKPKKASYHEAFPAKMLGIPKYNGEFDFTKRKLDVPTLFPLKKSSIDLRNINIVALFEKLDNSNIIYSVNRHRFYVMGRDMCSFKISDPCIRLVAGNGRGYMLTKKRMYIYEDKRIRVFDLAAIDLSISPFNEIFILTHDNILIFGENGLKEAFPYQGEVRFIHFYLFRELILVDSRQVFHLNLNKLELSVIHVTYGKIASTILKDRLYIAETGKVTSLSIEERVSETIEVRKSMKMTIGDTMLVLYTANREFLFCDRMDIKNNEGIIYDVIDLLGFFFVGVKSYFFFKDRFVMWNMGEIKVINLNNDEVKDYSVEFPDTLEILKKEYKSREKVTAMLRPNGTYERLTEIIGKLFAKEESIQAPSVPKKSMKYREEKKGGF